MKGDTFPDPMPVVLVEWIDSHFSAGWRGRDEAKREVHGQESATVCHSAGFLFYRGPKHLILALSDSRDADGGGQLADTLTIPQVAVRKVTYLKGRR